MRRLVLIAMAALLPVVLLLSACGDSQEEAETTSETAMDTLQSTTLAGLEWMLGTWKSSGGETENYETWMKAGPTEFTGRSYRLDNGDTSILELLTLADTDSGTFYIADVAHNPEPTWFTLTETDGMKATFENPMHGFPNKIIYKMSSPDSMTAILEGEEEGEQTQHEINFERVAE